MKIRTFRGRGRSGAAAVEFALVLTLLGPLLIGVWEIGRLVHVYQLTMNAAREAGRRAATGELTKAEIEQVVLTYMKTNGLSNIKAVAANEAELTKGGKVLVEIKMYDTTGTLVPNGDPRDDAEQMYKMEVTVSVLYNDVEYSPTDFFLPSDFLVSATAVWNSMKDIPVLINDAIPLA